MSADDAISQVESNHATYLKKHKFAAERDHMGEAALMVEGEIKGYFPTGSEAYLAGCDKYGLGNFSIQLIGHAPAQLGVLTPTGL